LLAAIFSFNGGALQSHQEVDREQHGIDGHGEREIQDHSGSQGDSVNPTSTILAECMDGRGNAQVHGPVLGCGGVPPNNGHAPGKRERKGEQEEASEMCLHPYVNQSLLRPRMT